VTTAIQLDEIPELLERDFGLAGFTMNGDGRVAATEEN
jgi:hypothetical protein